MQNLPFAIPLTVLVAAGLACSCFLPAQSAQSPASAAKPAIYVSDFELDVVPGKGANPSTAGAPAVPPTTLPGAKPLSAEQETRKRASDLVNGISASLMTELQKAGYAASRLRGGDGRPTNGVAIRGLFAEVDKENHWRRAVIHSSDDSGKMQAIVSVANLAKPEQAMYEIAHLPGNEARPGAVITLSPYVPLTKYEIDKQADQAVFQAVAARIVRDLTAFVTANPAALTQ